MYINWKQKELILTVALYGPQGSGKSTTWQYWAKRVPDPVTGDTFSLRTRQVQGKQLVLNIRDTPGGAEYSSRRRVSLYGVDGIIFVADSDPARREANEQSLQELINNLAAMQKSLLTMPFLLQYNKRDLPDALPLSALQALLNPRHTWNHHETSALHQEGLVDVLQHATQLILQAV